jgi:serine/threonine-protein kinase
MPLVTGASLGPYQILAPLGVGGMGEVYRARDTKLNRDVALKVLPEIFTADPERVARFQREAQLLASLNHPNIAAIYGLDESGGTRALVLELVEGPTLADRIAQGRIPPDEALPLARQVAEALEAAHEKGVIHRDLKPANVKVTADGVVKVLDFGLAKLLDPDVAAAGPPRAYSPAVTNSPTITTPAMTQMGVILGTAAYMSPEQAKGRPADKRSDIWAFGCVLYEMLTGKRAFDGDDVSDTLAFVLTKPVDFSALPAAVPPALPRLLGRCLERDRRKRLADASDARLEIEEAMSAPVEAPTVIPVPVLRLWPPQILLAAAALVMGGLIVGLAMRSTRPSTPLPAVVRFAIPLPEGQRFTENGLQVVAISPDGSRIAYVANRRLYLRSLSDLEARPIPGTEVLLGQSNDPVFSPDGNSIAYVAGRPASIKRVAITGGAPVTICEGCFASGAMSWDTDGLVFAQGGANSPTGILGAGAPEDGNRIMRVAVDDGHPKLLFNVRDGFPWNVQVLPGGDSVLFGFVPGPGLNNLSIAAGASFAKMQVAVQSMKSGQRRVLIEGGSGARYLPTGHIVYAREGILFARRFDPERSQVTGEEVPLVEGVRRPVFLGGNSPGTPYFDVSATGTLVYVPGPTTTAVQTDLALLDQQSGMTSLKLPPRPYEFPRVSPDGKQVAVGVNDGNTANIWIYELSGASSIRQLTFGGKNRFPIWSSDGRYVAFQSDRAGDLGIFQQRADGTGTAERLTTAEMGTAHVPDAWSGNGSQLVFEEMKDSRYTLQMLSVRERQIAAVGDIQMPLYLNATLSPDGRWVAYRSSSAGASAVSVEPLPPTGAKYLIGNGIHPVWSQDGNALFFRQLTTGEFMVTRVISKSGFSFTNPEILPLSFTDRTSNSTVRNHDILPDGRFLGVVSVQQEQGGTSTNRINVVLNWFEELKQRVPVN